MLIVFQSTSGVGISTVFWVCRSISAFCRSTWARLHSRTSRASALACSRATLHPRHMPLTRCHIPRCHSCLWIVTMSQIMLVCLVRNKAKFCVFKTYSKLLRTSIAAQVLNHQASRLTLQCSLLRGFPFWVMQGWQEILANVSLAVSRLTTQGACETTASTRGD